ncbi:hypothetical protein BDV95DRAFT_574328 [Massariosphaeria phaeospora]|uniref:Uncharacterized protein n=1 Tax=Massariosphaeria phaeospora TaxID=100035 RepID=A0A7C8M529_9PLEO|nr:hypothetical protein BDV95DRAFT_574328 [Massariosphaeria phaeospora]
MPAPLAKGLIIAASVIVAAGIAIYESPQVRQWVDQSRRKIAVALHSLGDEVQPPQRRASESTDAYEARRRDVVRRKRNDLIRRAREEGVAVDLDELVRIGREEPERPRPRTSASQRSFDDLVGSDGMLKTTGTESADQDTTLRRRGVAGFAAGSAAGAAMANPFDDDAAYTRFDHDEDKDEAPSPKESTYIEPGSRESSATVDAETPPLIDLTTEIESQHEMVQRPSMFPPHAGADNTDTEQAAQSFYSFTTSASHPHDRPFSDAGDDESIEHISTGTLTPRSERSGHSAVTGASVADSAADDIAVLSLQNDTDHDARSEGFSEGGFTDAGLSEAGDTRLGVMTPSSWTDVGSDDESEWGGPAQGGQVSQMHQ